MKGIFINELINGWTLKLPDKPEVYFETKIELLKDLNDWVENEQVKEYKLIRSGSGLQ